MRTERWQRTSLRRLVCFAVGMALFLVLVFASEPGFVFLLDHANLLFHEAGHPFVGLFSRRLEPYGGTLGQFVFPVGLAISFWRKGQALSFAASVVWFFENFLNLSRYLADARALQLPLVGGGDHDWNTILSRWHVLAYDTQIAMTVKIVGWVGIISVCIWVGWRFWVDRNRPEEPDKFSKWELPQLPE